MFFAGYLEADFFERQRSHNAAAFRGFCKKNIIIIGAYAGIKSSHAQRIQKGKTTSFGWVIQNQKILILNKLNVPEIIECLFGYGFAAVFLATKFLTQSQQVWDFRRVHRETKSHA
ncbi:hypothetical protein N9D03_02910 [Alphaproteobacteria bacterium]|jgi:hypothetical protein|nr:hypothetical protein [Alphaproteobacteria bacterium]